jgi:hypothetical protein
VIDLMEKKASNSPHLSQFEAVEARRRVVLLGASNLSLTFPMVVETALDLFGRPLEFFVAMGFGRSYGQESKFFRKIFSGILECELWDALDRARPLSTVAVAADIGNDLPYEVPVTAIVESVKRTLDALETRGVRAVLNNIPLPSIQALSPARYALMRRILFPRSRMSHGELMRRADALSGALETLAAERNTPIFTGENAWYGFDPIHPRRKWAGEIWQRMFAAAAPNSHPVVMRRPPRREARTLRRLQSRAWYELSRGGGATVVSARLADGSSLALF